MIFCKHDYEIINQFETKSIFEQFEKRFTNIEGNYLIFRKKYITDFKCKKCKKLKRFVIKI